MEAYDAHCHLQVCTLGRARQQALEPPWAAAVPNPWPATLQDDRLPAEDLEGILADAAANGVTRFAVNGCCPADWARVLEIAGRHPAVTPNLGLHPWWVPGCSGGDWLSRLRALLLENPQAGLGEVRRPAKEGLGAPGAG